MRVPVVDAEKHPLMPTTAARARLLLNRGRASAYWSKSGKRTTQLAKPTELKVLTRIAFRTKFIKTSRGEQREAIPLTAKAVSFLALGS